ncbi:MAG: N-acyl-D-amino-acid deacylase [Hyphomicrobiaceae bacterium]|jgi:N-acyl-D-amino-acid deacylase
MAGADIIIRNTQLIDGTGGPMTAADVAITGDRISAIGPNLGTDAAEQIDAGGLALAPGFIDAHTHDDRIVLADPGMACKISQGVTSVVTGNCGISIAPVRLSERPPAPLDLIGQEPKAFFATFSEYFAALDQSPPAVNVIAQVGHSSLRVMAMSDLNRTATAAEIETMRSALRQSLEQGAAGFSTGLAYQPAHEASTEEIEALAEVVAEFKGFHSTHMRDEGAGVMDSLAETFRIGRTAEIPVIVSHHKCAGIPNHGKSEITLPYIEKALANQRITLDCYPYVASSTVLDPYRVQEASNTVIAWSTTRPEFAGQDLTDIASEMGVDIAQAIEALQPAGAIYFNMHEDDVRRILSFPQTMIGSDGLPHDEHPHPRLWGTFPRVLGHYSRDVGLFGLEEAVRKMTSLTAQTFGIKDRGVVAEGCFADLVLFDPKEIIDSATFAEPVKPAAGISRVFVNGSCVWQEGAATGLRPGRGLQRQGLTPLNFAA